MIVIIVIDFLSYIDFVPRVLKGFGVLTVHMIQTISFQRRTNDDVDSNWLMNVIEMNDVFKIMWHEKKKHIRFFISFAIIYVVIYSKMFVFINFMIINHYALILRNLPGKMGKITELKKLTMYDQCCCVNNHVVNISMMFNYKNLIDDCSTKPFIKIRVIEMKKIR